ncbi:hypothetical protein KPL71_009102 [Citrus sinensis]|uniref:Uncharacterized protein n=1 Tax=Citrus sinensis TaxID=2711 RepID=A0ACB8MCN9_CITSI|nr:hypothetical protein KPL71_009102 [Citrus sinensis]
MSSLSPLTIILSQNKLTGENYIDWKINLFIVLTAEKYKYVLTQPCPPVSVDDAHRNQRRLYEKWQKANEMAKCYILSSISNILQTKHQNLEIATEIMDSLQQMFGQSTRSARQAALKGIMNSKMGKGTRVCDHVLKMMDNLNEAEIQETQIDDNSKIDMVLESLPETFKEFKVNYNINKRNMSLIELMNELHSAEEIYCAEKSLGSINITEKSSSSRPKPKGKGKKKAGKKRPSTKSIDTLEVNCKCLKPWEAGLVKFSSPVCLEAWTMRVFLQALDYEIWEIVNDGPFMPTSKSKEGAEIPKPSSQWTRLEKKKMSLYSKAMNAFFCALDKKEFHRVSSCENAYEIWKKLKVVDEGTNQAKECKISRFIRQYEMFQMESYECVHDMYTRFTDIVNSLEALRKIFSNCEKVKKIIRSLRKEWRPKRTAIEEAKNLNALSLDDLIGSPISYEEDIANERIDEDKKKKSFAFKSSIVESDNDGSDFEDEGIEMIARKFRRILKKQIKRRNFKDLMRENLKAEKGKKEAIVCFECKKRGHIRSECPLLNKLKKKVIVATWDDSDEESSDEEDSQEVSNLALMAIRDDELDEVNDLPTYNELYDAFKELYDELMKVVTVENGDPTS